MKEAPKSKVIANRKKELYHKSDQFKSAVTSDINRLKFDLGRIGKNFLIIGGSLYVAYKLSKMIIGSSTREVPPGKLVSTKESSVMVNKIKEQIALFLLALAFKKLKEFVQENRKSKNEQENS